jgi:hypothetical protein
MHVIRHYDIGVQAEVSAISIEGKILDDYLAQPRIEK